MQFIAAACAEGETVLTDAAELRVKEVIESKQWQMA
jgi:5-enolpyruvylshikimate-3-phosphate synthase